MGSRAFLIMLVVFVLGGVALWYAQNANRLSAPSAATRSINGFEVRRPEWPDALRSIRIGMRELRFSIERMGAPTILSPFLAIAALLLGGFLIAYLMIKLVYAVFSGGASMIGGLVHLVVAPLWQVGLAFVSALQTVEWLQEKGFISTDLSTPAYVGFALVSMVLMLGLARVKQPQTA